MNPQHIQENLLSSSFILLRALKVWCRLKTHFLITELMLLYAVQSYKTSDWNYPTLYFIFSFIFSQRQWRTLNTFLNTRTDQVSSVLLTKTPPIHFRSGRSRGWNECPNCKNNSITYSHLNCKRRDRSTSATSVMGFLPDLRIIKFCIQKVLVFNYSNAAKLMNKC